jgi:hypothetical protein
VGISKEGVWTLQDEKKFFVWHLYEKEERINISKVQDLLQRNPEALSKFKSGKSNNIISTVIGGVRGFMPAYTLGQTAAGVKANWTVGGIGAGLVVVSIPLNISANQKVKNPLRCTMMAYRLHRYGERICILALPEMG